MRCGAEEKSTKDGYNAIQVGFGSKKNQRVNKPEQGHMAKAGKGAFEVLKEFRLDDVSQFQVGQEIKAADLFKAGDRIDVSGTSKGHGFTGVIKVVVCRIPRVSRYPRILSPWWVHRQPFLSRSSPERKKMAGHWGNERISAKPRGRRYPA